MSTTRFAWQDLELFSKASHDNSRLHMSHEYARRTAYGEPIVFGILGAFAALGALRDRPGEELAKISLKYRGPLYMGVDYAIEANESWQDRAKVALSEGGSPLLSADFRFRPATGDVGSGEVPGIAPLSEQAEWNPEELRPGLQATGRYAADPSSLQSLIERWRLIAKGATVPQITTMLWSSYLTGMQLPGLRGTSAQLLVTFRPEGPPPEIPFDYEASVLDFDERFSLLHNGAQLIGNRGPFADAEVWSHIRIDPLAPLEG